MKHYLYEFRTRRVRRSVARELPNPYEPVNNARDVAGIVRALVDGDAREHMFVICLDVKNRVLGFESVGVGTLASLEVHPREVFRPAIVAPAAAILMSHNHPSGDPEPSPEDQALTTRMRKAGELLGIPLLDHIIVGAERHFSYAESWTELP